MFSTASASAAVSANEPSKLSQKTESVAPQTLLAQNKKKSSKSKARSGKSSKGKKSEGRKRYLQGEARASSSKTEIDFDAAAIDGERRTPVGVQIGSNKQDHGYDLINLRLRWHPEMIKSTSNLETGKGK